MHLANGNQYAVQSWPSRSLPTATLRFQALRLGQGISSVVETQTGSSQTHTHTTSHANKKINTMPQQNKLFWEMGIPECGGSWRVEL